IAIERAAPADSPGGHDVKCTVHVAPVHLREKDRFGAKEIAGNIDGYGGVAAGVLAQIENDRVEVREGAEPGVGGVFGLVEIGEQPDFEIADVAAETFEFTESVVEAFRRGGLRHR